MSVPSYIKIQHGELPKSPGVYLMKDAKGSVLYVGKATSLRERVKQHFERPHDNRIEKMTRLVRQIDYKKTPTVIEALILEANLIKKFQPRYNALLKDDKSFLHLVFTNDKYPRVVFVRGYELARLPRKNFSARGGSASGAKKVFGPFTNPAALRASMEILRKIFPWSTCVPGAKRPCFYSHIGRCPGVCVFAISHHEYGKIIKNLILFFEGKRTTIVRRAKREMRQAVAARNFEEAVKLRDQIFSLEHIQDVAVLKREEFCSEGFINIYGRIEGYDISNIGGQSPVGSMVVFENGEPKKSAYRKFHIKTVRGANDVAMLREMLSRRFARQVNQNSSLRGQRPKQSRSTQDEIAAPRLTGLLQGARLPAADLAMTESAVSKCPLPQLIVIDGGRGQVNAALAVLSRRKLRIPVVGLAKGFDRKQDVPVYDKNDWELRRVVEMNKVLLQHVRDEAHRFAVVFHRKAREKKFLKGN